MIVYPFPQGSPAWRAARCGKITASATERFFNPNKLELRRNRAGDDLADGSVTYVYELLAEWYFGVPTDSGSTQFMRRGSHEESAARAAYELDTMSDVTECGFIGSDCGRFGSSVDGLVGEDGIVEIKILSAREHLRVYHAGSERAYAQVQAQMADTGRRWSDRFFWHPDARLYVPPMRTERDEAFIDALQQAREVVAKRLRALKQRHIDGGFVPPPFDPRKWDANGEPVFDPEESARRIKWIETCRARRDALDDATGLESDTETSGPHLEASPAPSSTEAGAAGR